MHFDEQKYEQVREFLAFAQNTTDGPWTEFQTAEAEGVISGGRQVGRGGGGRNKVRQLSGETAASRSQPSVVYTVESVSMQKKKKTSRETQKKVA